jgi:excinuclease UvrABC nuclease subunit
MQREPVLVPRKPGVFALVNKSKREAYVAFTSDLQKRSHSIAHMLQNPKTHWSIRNLGKDRAGAFTFIVVAEDVEELKSPRLVKHTEKEFLAKKYRIVEGARSTVPLVVYKGEEMPLTDAIAKSKCKAKYITVWRRLDRGWTVEQALDLEEPPVRWDPEQTRERRKRAEKRAA